MFGLFGFIGYNPKCELFEGKLELENGYIKTDENMHTNRYPACLRRATSVSRACARSSRLRLTALLPLSRLSTISRISIK